MIGPYHSGATVAPDREDESIDNNGGKSMPNMGGKIKPRTPSARLEARKLVEDDILDQLSSSSSDLEFEELVDDKVEYILEAESLLEAQDEPRRAATEAA